MPSELVPLHRLEGSDAGPVWRRDTQLKVILDDDVDYDVDNDVGNDVGNEVDDEDDDAGLVWRRDTQGDSL